jgi:hypothetical protein
MNYNFLLEGKTIQDRRAFRTLPKITPVLENTEGKVILPEGIPQFLKTMIETSSKPLSPEVQISLQNYLDKSARSKQKEEQVVEESSTT